jgi:hypothetical protein
MNHFHLLVPNLFPPQDIAAEVCAGLSLPALEKLLTRAAATTLPAITLEDSLCTSFGAQAVAPVRAAADGLDASDGYWLCADPVNLQLQRAEMLLFPEVALSGDEAAALCASLNGHFADSEMKFYAPHPQRWYVQLQAAPQLATTPLNRVAWRDAKFHQPQGADTLHWQRVMTEVQMLLYAHPFNQAREARGESLISSLWLWGGGQATPLKAAFDAVGGDSALGRSFAHAAGVALVAGLQDMLQCAGANGLWLNEAMGDAQQRGDYHAWREAAMQFERDCALLWQALRAGRLQRLTLEVAGGNGLQHFELSRAATWRFWRPLRSLPHYAV